MGTVSQQDNGCFSAKVNNNRGSGIAAVTYAFVLFEFFGDKPGVRRLGIPAQGATYLFILNLKHLSYSAFLKNSPPVQLSSVHQGGAEYSQSFRIRKDAGIARVAGIESSRQRVVYDPKQDFSRLSLCTYLLRCAFPRDKNFARHYLRQHILRDFHSFGQVTSMF